jgi:hypothetical protein
MEQLSFTLELRKSKRPPNRTDLTATRAREVLDYDPETGVLTWRVRPARHVKAGSVAGYVSRQPRTSYRVVKIDGVLYLAHRVCFLHFYGAWPSAEIDHQDQNGLNNRISNLRAVTRAGNAQNQPKQSRNKSGVTGVSWNRACRKWRAAIRVCGVQDYLGQFDTLADAAHARKLAERRYNFHPNHGRAQEAA